MLEKNLTDNAFLILNAPQQFEQDETQLNQRWKELQIQMHPDRFVTQDLTTQRLATQWSIRINEAYQNLKDPVQRATLLCELAGVPINLETNTSMPPTFLIQQMQWREALEDATTPEHMHEIQNKVNHKRAVILSSLSCLMDEMHDYAQAAQQVRELVFMDRFLTSINSKLDTLGF